MNIRDYIHALWNRMRELMGLLGQDAPAHERSPQERQQTSPPVIRSELYIPQAVIERYDTQQQNEATEKRWRRGFDIATVIMGIAGFFILIATLCETRRATNALVESSRLDKRAWVGLGDIRVPDPPSTDKPLSVIARVKNSGESPAVRTFVKGELHLWISESGDRRVPPMEHLDFAFCPEAKFQWRDTLGGATILPGADTVSLSRKSDALPEAFVKLVKGEPTAQFEKEDLEAIRTAPNTSSGQQAIGLYLVGCINYFDVFKEAHRTSFCVRYVRSSGRSFPNGSFVACDYGNDAD